MSKDEDTAKGFEESRSDDLRETALPGKSPKKGSPAFEKALDAVGKILDKSRKS